MKKVRNSIITGFAVAAFFSSCGGGTSPNKTNETQDAASGDLAAFVQISKRDPRYFELSNGNPYIPIGLNMTFPRGLQPNTDDDLTKMENEWIKPFAENKGNFVRIWLGHDAFQIERERSGVYDENQTQKIAQLIEICRKYGIRVKLTTEHFRHIGDSDLEWHTPEIFTRTIYYKNNGGPAESTKDFFAGEAGRALYKKKLDWYAEHFGDDPIIYGWELWNEMNAVNIPIDLVWTWSTEMLAELHKRFPKNLAMQSLGSYDNEEYRSWYRNLCGLAGNDVLQVHRYLDLGAPWKICHESVALLTAGAIKEMLAFKVPKPVILAEAGAVEPNHSGPFKLFAKDTAGIILHDVLFAPFFVGAAGSGQCWHWESYVAANNLWFHFSRFAAAVEDLDPPAENFQPFEVEHDRLYLYGLKGKMNTLVWCRDKQNTWKTELEEGKEPEMLSGILLDFDAKDKTVRFYNPWKNRWTDGKGNAGKIVLPDFRRSLVISIK